MSKKTIALAMAAVVAGLLARPATAQTVDEVMSRFYEAMGGVAGWTGLQTMTASGTLSVANGLIEGPFEMVQKRPAMARMEITVQGMDIVSAYDGDTAWQIFPLTGSTEPEIADPATAKQLAERADLDGPLIGWKEAGHTVEVAGRETVDGVETIKLKLTLKTGEVSYYYLDAEDYVPIRIVDVREIQGQPTELTTVLDEYREVGGLLFPFSIEVDTPGGKQVLAFDRIEVNVPVDESVFSMPSDGAS